MILHFLKPVNTFFYQQFPLPCCGEKRYNVCMQIEKTQGWSDYQLLDSGNGQKLERFGEVTVVRPDPQIIWKPSNAISLWQNADVAFQRTTKDQGIWKWRTKKRDSWLLQYRNLTFNVRLTPFKHTGVFPEQTVQWDWMEDKIKKSNRPISVLNLFAYTGGASIMAAAAGARVTHVDASRPAITWARDNQKASGLEDRPIRWILDDALKFAQREVKRGVTYDGIIMDPPSYGHGPTGEIWKFNENFPQLMETCSQLLSENPLFFIINAYAISSSALMLENVLQDYLKNKNGEIEVGELVLQEQTTNRLLSTGIYGRWSC